MVGIPEESEIMDTLWSTLCWWIWSESGVNCKLAELGDLTINQSVLKICCQRTAILELHFPISSINSAAKIFTTGGFKGLFRINTLVPCDFAWKCESPHTWSWGICLAQVCHFHTYVHWLAWPQKTMQLEIWAVTTPWPIDWCWGNGVI